MIDRSYHVEAVAEERAALALAYIRLVTNKLKRIEQALADLLDLAAREHSLEYQTK